MITQDMKKSVKTACAELCTRTHMTGAVLGVRKMLNGSVPVVILMYHRVLPAEKMRTVFSTHHIVTTTADFEAQIRFLTRRYEVFALDQYAEMRRNPESMPKKCAIITFDDGWDDNYHHAFPILKKYKVPATIFLATGFIGQKHAFWQERLRFLMHRFIMRDTPTETPLPEALQAWSHELDRIRHSNDPQEVMESIIRSIKGENEAVGQALVEALDARLGSPEFPTMDHGFLTWDQVREMAGHGITFGAHTRHHRLLTGLSPREIDGELTASKKGIEAELKREITAFAYPGGMYRPEIFGQLESAGYRLALTTRPGLNFADTHPYQLHRINIAAKRFQNRNGRFSEGLFGVYLAGMLT